MRTRSSSWSATSDALHPNECRRTLPISYRARSIIRVSISPRPDASRMERASTSSDSPSRWNHLIRTEVSTRSAVIYDCPGPLELDRPPRSSRQTRTVVQIGGWPRQPRPGRVVPTPVERPPPAGRSGSPTAAALRRRALGSTPQGVTPLFWTYFSISSIIASAVHRPSSSTDRGLGSPRLERCRRRTGRSGLVWASPSCRRPVTGSPPMQNRSGPQ